MADIVDRSASILRKERRAHPRLRITAAVEITSEQSGKIVDARLANLGLGGCQVETKEPFDLGAEVNVTISREGASFQAQARVVCTVPGQAIGLLFTSIEPASLRTVETWLETTQESQWLAFHRRRSQRVVMQLSVRVSGKDNFGSPFTEDTVTEIVSANGALILLAAPVTKGQRLVVTNPRTQTSLECAIVYFGHVGTDHRRQVGLNFALQDPDFWQIRFPPAATSPR
jgi:hypothetical protein